MTENDVNPPINNDPVEKRNEFIDHPRRLDEEANKLYDRKYDLYEAALLIKCYTQHALRP